MLKLMARMTAIALVVGGALVAAPAAGPAFACDKVEDTSDFGQVTVGEDCDGDSTSPSTEDPTGTEGSDGDDAGDGEPRVCTTPFFGEVPCNHKEYGAWNGSCWLQVADPQPAADSPLWEGHDDGYIVACTAACSERIIAEEPNSLVPCRRDMSWSAQAPGVTGPSAQELARRAVAQMDLDTGEIGSTPPSKDVQAGSVGLIGVPIWLWVSNPADNTTGPITRTASGGGLTVTATGTLDRVEWQLAGAGGSRTVTCAGDAAAGTPWAEGISDGGRASSPTCGFGAGDNSQAGNLTLTGTAYWHVEWSSNTQDGTIDVTAPSRSAQLEVAEVQVLVQ